MVAAKWMCRWVLSGAGGLKGPGSVVGVGQGSLTRVVWRRGVRCFFKAINGAEKLFHLPAAWLRRC